jgi:hypothetical protein
MQAPRAAWRALNKYIYVDVGCPTQYTSSFTRFQIDSAIRRIKEIRRMAEWSVKYNIMLPMQMCLCL